VLCHLGPSGDNLCQFGTGDRDITRLTLRCRFWCRLALFTCAHPFEVWMALARDIRRPQVEHPPLRIMRFSGKALSEGVEHHKIESVSVRVYCPAKTVADCFKFRNKIGLDVAVEALRDCLRRRKCTRDQLWQYAKVCRVTEVMRPYLEAVL
jgi:hypothetical protein